MLSPERFLVYMIVYMIPALVALTPASPTSAQSVSYNESTERRTRAKVGVTGKGAGMKYTSIDCTTKWIGAGKTPASVRFVSAIVLPL